MVATRRFVRFGGVALFVAGVSAAAVGGASPAADAASACANPSKIRAFDATVVDALDGETLALADGRRIRLAGALAPAAPSRLPADEPWPLAQAARAHLKSMAAGQSVRVLPVRRKRDRYGNILGIVVPWAGAAEDVKAPPESQSDRSTASDAGASLQWRMLRAGLARVVPHLLTHACAARLLSAEADARTANRGVWAHAHYAVRPSDDVAALLAQLNTYQVTEGRVRSIGARKRNVYLNFGRRWRTDLTVRVRRGRRGIGTELEAALTKLEGRRVRVRGWVVRDGGPLIAVSHPAQIELLDGRT